MALGCVPGANLDGFWPQKSTKICSWTALGPSFGRLGPSWDVLEASEDVLKRHQKMIRKKIHEKSGKNASPGVFGQFCGGGSTHAHGRGVDAVCPGHGHGFRSGALN